MTAERIKITYATLRADNEELQQQYEAGLERAKARLGQVHRNVVDGAERDGDGTFEVRSPIDTDILVGTFAKGTRGRRPGRDRGRAAGAAGVVPARLGAAARDPQGAPPSSSASARWSTPG